MPLRILHLSDLHYPDGRDEAVETALRRLVAAEQPALAVVTGDLVHGGRVEEEDAVAAFLRGLGVPLLVVPGDHDVRVRRPGTPLRPFAHFERNWGRSPVHRGDGVVAVGLGSVRLAGKLGRLRERDLAALPGLFAGAGADELRLVAFHHSPLEAPWRSGRRAIRDRGRALRGLAESRVGLVLAGHIHQPTLSTHAELDVDVAGGAPMVLAVAPAFGRPRPERPPEIRGLNVVDVEPGEIRVRTLVWAGSDWETAVEHRAPRRPAWRAPRRPACGARPAHATDAG